MRNFVTYFWSSVGKKLIISTAGFALMIFIFIHLLGNLTLYGPPSAVNAYGEKLHSLGWLLYATEVGLLLVFVVHIFTAVIITISNFRARSGFYKEFKSKGKPSKKNWSSSTMIYTGAVIGIFLVIHLLDFRFGPGINDGNVAYVGGKPVKDFYTLVAQRFSHLGGALFYIAVMIFLGFHLRHGFWSAFQTLGLTYPRYSGIIYSIGVAFAILIGFGFFLIPLYFYFTGGAL